jgi:hypothetical protein
LTEACIARAILERCGSIAPPTDPNAIPTGPSGQNTNSSPTTTWTRESLQEKTTDELRAIMKQNSIPKIDKGVILNILILQAANKATYVKSILGWQSVGAKEKREYLKALSSPPTPPDLPHQLYREQFNAIDLLDRQYYALQNHHTIEKWQPKYIMSMLQVAIVNGTTIANTFRNFGLLDFYGEISTYLCNPDLKFPKE